MHFWTSRATFASTIIRRNFYFTTNHLKYNKERKKKKNHSISFPLQKYIFVSSYFTFSTTLTMFLTVKSTCPKYLLMLKCSGRWTNLIILRRRCRIFNFLFNVRHSPIISNHIFGAATGHHTNLKQSAKWPCNFSHMLFWIIFYNAIIRCCSLLNKLRQISKKKRRQPALQSAALFFCCYF